MGFDGSASLRNGAMVPRRNIQSPLAQGSRPVTTRVLVWATVFGADLWSFTRFLDARDDVEVKVVLDQPKRFAQEGVSALFPLHAELFARGMRRQVGRVASWQADVTIFDSWRPLHATTPAGMALWHGFGWKGPDDEAVFASLHADIERAWGSAKSPNPRFRWQCFGPWDLEYRSGTSGIHAENCRLVGAASHDDLRVPLDRGLARPYYPFDVARRKTVLFAPTWHYGEVFAHWGNDADLFERLLLHCRRRDVDVILRLHDSYRFGKSYVHYFRDLERRHDHVVVKFKDTSPDNFLDLQVADVLITNYSSIANLFYATLRPTIHIYPVRSADEAFMRRSYSRSHGLRAREIESVRYIWKLPPETNGGLMARDFNELLSQFDEALDDPDCCKKPARKFLDQHMMGADGGACERALAALREITQL